MITCVHSWADRKTWGGGCRETGGGGTVEGSHICRGAFGLQGLHSRPYGSKAEAVLLHSPRSLGGGGIGLSLKQHMILLTFQDSSQLFHFHL